VLKQSIVPQQGIPLAGYRRALRFIVPYWPRLVLILAAGMASTGFGLLEPYISKLRIGDALLKRDLRMLLLVTGMLFVTIAGFGLNILSSYTLCSSVGRGSFLTCAWRSIATSRRCRRDFGRGPSSAT